ncbi:hypothetical protein FVF58_45625 [Paraburkholderia panacisoli]|uniref:PXPV repeat-containing protein n=1 Tax=Paraburkholderia panacisoli TaxID=2603818 RepID=A0A5B0G410_9BURK|nr:hypothetical protein [Paraburkholderia panacisoli]KAA0998174.1 hypothetical protein FVF58_45625 [Paraburkholderia panacisoli]
MKRALVLSALGICCACASGLASAHADVNVFLGVPGPVYVAPPPVVYQPPPVVYAPAPVYRYGYQGEYRDERRRHDNGKHKGWYKHHRDDDEQ